MKSRLFAAVGIVAAVGGISVASVFAQAAIPTRYCWVDGAPAKRVKTLPVGSGGAIQPDGSDSRRAHDPATGTIYVTPDGGETWKNARTGEPVETLPVAPNDTPVAAVRADPADGTHAHDPRTGRDFVRVACPPLARAADAYLGGELLENFSDLQTNLPPYPIIQTQFEDSGSRHGAGLVAGGNVTFSSHRIVIGPFVSFDLLNQTINHTFPAGSFNGGFLGATTRWNALLGTKVGIGRGRAFIYGLGGIRWLSEDLTQNNLYTIPANLIASSRTTTTGYTAGGGVELRPRGWQLGRIPLALFAQYEHTGWQGDALAATPQQSDLANGYGFTRTDNAIKFGVDIHSR